MCIQVNSVFQRMLLKRGTGNGERGTGNGEWREWGMKTGESCQRYEIWGHNNT